MRAQEKKNMKLAGNNIYLQAEWLKAILGVTCLH